MSTTVLHKCGHTTLGVKKLGALSQSKAKELSRESLECDLTFAGFIVISCPLKVDSKAVIKELVHASHHVAMITGDNPLTACHVARELRFTKSKSTLILTGKSSNEWGWESVNEEIWIPIEVSYCFYIPYSYLSNRRDYLISEKFGKFEKNN